MAEESGDDWLWPGRGVFAALAVLSLGVFAALIFAVSPLAAGVSAALFLVMALITLIDLRHFIVPDVLSLPAIPAGLVANALFSGGWDGVLDGVAGALTGAGVFYLLRLGYARLRGVEGLGLGDVKLAGVAGAWLGPAALAPACLVATLAAILGVLLHIAVRGRNSIEARSQVPFGSFIAPVIFAFWLISLLDLPIIW